MQLRSICKSKIHRATVTGADIDYIGSIAIDETLLRLTGIAPGEKVGVWNINNGERIETYAMPAPAGSGSVIVNGAAARRFRERDQVIIVAFVLADEPVQPRMILVNGNNQFIEYLAGNPEPEQSPADTAAPAGEIL